MKLENFRILLPKVVQKQQQQKLTILTGIKQSIPEP